MPKEVSDAALLAQLGAQTSPQPVTNPDIIAALNEQSARDADAARSRDIYERVSPVDQFGLGVARTATDAYYGIKELIAGLSPEEQENLLRMQQVHGGYGTAGRVAGDVATLAVPMGAAAKLARVASRGRAALAAGDGALVAGYAGLKAPDQDETRLGNAVSGAAASVAGSAAAAALRRVALGITKSQAAQELLDAGVRLTPGMASASRVVPAVERVMADTPLVRGKVRELQAQAVSDAALQKLRAVAERLVREAAPSTQAGAGVLPAMAEVAGVMSLPHVAIPALAATRMMVSEPGRRAILGETAVQDALQRIGRSAAARRVGQYVRTSETGLLSQD